MKRRRDVTPQRPPRGSETTPIAELPVGEARRGSPIGSRPAISHPLVSSIDDEGPLAILLSETPPSKSNTQQPDKTMTPTIIQSTSLYYRAGRSDKGYQAAI